MKKIPCSWTSISSTITAETWSVLRGYTTAYSLGYCPCVMGTAKTSPAAKFRLMAMISPEDSWVAKWQRTERFVSCYAVSVTGRLPPGVIRNLCGQNIEYRHRDTSQKS